MEMAHDIGNWQLLQPRRCNLRATGRPKVAKRLLLTTSCGVNGAPIFPGIAARAAELGQRDMTL